MPEFIRTLLPYLPYIYLGLISLIAFFVTLYDKAVAGLSYKLSPKDKDGKSNKKGPKLRVPESALLILSVLGGSLAMLLTMLLIRHKTKKPKFMVGIPVILILQIAAVSAVILLL